MLWTCVSRAKDARATAPVNVDMATYKAEFLSRYYKGRLRPIHAYTIGLIMYHARLAQYAPRLANLATQTPGLKALLKRAGRFPLEREIPPFAHQTFKAWFRERRPRNLEAPPVVLFADTFNNHLHPEVAKATLEVLENAGYRVIVPQEPLCCGRPLYDYGMLDTAKGFLRRLTEGLSPYVREGVPMVGVEPSCVAALRDELPEMLPHDEDAMRLSRKTMTLAEFLLNEANGYQSPKLNRKALVHGHCHQEAVMRLDAEQELYEKMGLDFEVLDSGCCGLAGSFGFEAEHYDVSMKVGERRLLPAARGADRDALIMADGFSCKTQIEHGTDRRALHTAQVIKMALECGESGPAGDYPERGYPDVILDGQSPDLKTAAVVGGAIGGAALLWRIRRRFL
jgi:Fe-S oxidoreductase